MRAIGYLSILFSALLFTTVAHADSLYRQRLPITVTMASNDRLYLSYDFSEKKGIRCTSNASKIHVDFAYKGKEKTAFLPILLQSDHIPHKADEALADVTGRLVIYTEEAPQKVEVNCGYVEK